MKNHKFLALLSIVIFISCSNENMEKHYESDKIIVVFKENNNFLATKSINLSFGAADTILKAKNYNFKTIDDLFIKILESNQEKLSFNTATNYDIVITKKDSLLSDEKFYEEFKIFLKKRIKLNFLNLSKNVFVFLLKRLNL